jgi:hypothetical protein
MTPTARHRAPSSPEAAPMTPAARHRAPSSLEAAR